MKKLKPIKDKLNGETRRLHQLLENPGLYGFHDDEMFLMSFRELKRIATKISFDAHKRKQK